LSGGNVVLAATWRDGGGVYGVSFTRMSGNGTSGLPNTGVTSLIADPADQNRFYAGVPAGPFAGVYRGYRGSPPGQHPNP
jgi:hypothetical protein